MKKFKKFSALFLVFTMLMSLCITANAENGATAFGLDRTIGAREFSASYGFKSTPSTEQDHIGGWTGSNAYIKVGTVDFGETNTLGKVSAELASSGTSYISVWYYDGEVSEDDTGVGAIKRGTKICDAVYSADGWNKFVSAEGYNVQSVTGEHTVYIIYDESAADLKSITFISKENTALSAYRSTNAAGRYDVITVNEATVLGSQYPQGEATSGSGYVIDRSSNSLSNVAYGDDETPYELKGTFENSDGVRFCAWARFDNVDFGDDYTFLKDFNVLFSSYWGGSVTVYMDPVVTYDENSTVSSIYNEIKETGTELGTGKGTQYGEYASLSTAPTTYAGKIKGKHTLYLVSTGAPGRIAGFFFTSGSRSAYDELDASIPAALGEGIGFGNYKYENGVFGSMTWDSSWLGFDAVDFGAVGAKSFEIKGCNMTADINVYIDPTFVDSTSKTYDEIKTTGTLIGTFAKQENTDDWSTIVTYDSGFVTKLDLTGVHDVYLVFSGGAGNFASIKFNEGLISFSAFKDYTAEYVYNLNNADNPTYGDYKYGSGMFGSAQAAPWLRFRNVNFGENGATQIICTAESLTENARLYINPNKTNGISKEIITSTGTLIGTIIGNNKTSWGEKAVYTGEISYYGDLSGVHDVYMVLDSPANFCSIKFVDGKKTISAFEEMPVTMTSYISPLTDGDGGPRTVSPEGTINNVNQGTWFVYSNVDFGDIYYLKQLAVKYAGEMTGIVTFVMDPKDTTTYEGIMGGTVLGSVVSGNTGSWNINTNAETHYGDAVYAEPISGTHDIYVVTTSGIFGNIASISFTEKMVVNISLPNVWNNEGMIPTVDVIYNGSVSDIQSFKVVVGYYSDDNELLGVKLYDYIVGTGFVDNEALAVPALATKAKAFAFESMENIYPLCDNAELLKTE